jgi:predicted SnoaL-like aldol condensation-catalyzing enzyme
LEDYAREENMIRVMILLMVLGSVLLTRPACGAGKQEEQNKKIVMEFYDQAINQKDFAAASKYMGPRYTQHNPMAADGPGGLKDFIQFLSTKYPGSHSEIKRILADGDFVVLHVHAVRVPGTRGNAIIDIFKLENGKIVEHWDVTQEIPEKAANANGMF